MLVLGSKTVTVDGVTVYADHADPRQFWYLPAPVALAERAAVPQFTLIRYRPAVADGGVQGGGFLMMEVELRLDPGVERRIMGAVSQFSDGAPRADARCRSTTARCRSSRSTSRAAAAPRRRRRRRARSLAVESILGATKPSLAAATTPRCSASR